MDLNTHVLLPTDYPGLAGRIAVVRRRRFAVGIDIGQAHDPTAIAVVTKITTEMVQQLLPERTEAEWAAMRADFLARGYVECSL